ncbi:alkaline shock response membrane anchor protein AmaP [Streptomyces ovatisporus]|uniref:Alkaline shock response membrane anchor protein AmaP n=1 Tax=Streptomyces ovatisporus TaxID=1128682 RepID=A0ABV9ADX8_9ACTN
MGGILRSVNRVLLGLAGLLLLALGLAVLVAGFDLPRHLNFALPADWPWTATDDVLLTDAERTRWRSESWWWPAVIAALSLLVILLLWWLLSQLRRRRLREVLVETGDGEGALLRGSALEKVLEAEAAGLPGVDRAAVRLTGRRTAPQAVMGLRLEPHAAPGPVLGRLTEEALEHARSSAALEQIPAEVQLRTVKHRPERAL